MNSMQSDLNGNKIFLKSYQIGSHKTTCPRCSHSRKHKSDACLWVNVTDINLALWKCHNCYWTGSAGDVGKKNGENFNEKKALREYKKPAPIPETITLNLPQNISDYLVGTRKITPEVLLKNRIYFDHTKNCICFPYHENGEVINIKSRTLDKKFWLSAGAKLAFYGIDGVDFNASGDLIIVEGEIDKLSLEVAGLTNVVSVPNGAPAKPREGDVIDNTGQFEYLIHAEKIIKSARRVILAVDNDKVGEVLKYELIRRIGPAKCWFVTFPETIKDSNDMLVQLGVDEVLYLFQNATACPISGLYTVDDFQLSLGEYYTQSMHGGVSTGFYNLDWFYTIMPGEITIVTGIPNSGKSEIVDAIMVNLAKNNNWKFAIFSPENGKEQHVTKLVEKVAGITTSPYSQYRMEFSDFMSVASWVNSYFYFIVADDAVSLPTLDWILEKAAVAVFRYGINGIVIDPYNEIEHQRPANMTETEYVSTILSKIKRFAKNHKLHIWIIAHPTKMLADKDGKIRVPSLYDISGSANWVNKTDNGLVIFRSEDASNQTEIHIKKIRFKHVGKRGQCALNYDKDTGRYSVPPTDKELGVPDNDMRTWDVLT